MTDETPPARTLHTGQRARLRIWQRSDGSVRTVYESATLLFEAPNWAADGQVIINGDGLLWTMPADGSTPPTPIPTEALPAVNNDHVLSPDGATIHASANDWHIWSVPIHGGTARRRTAEDGSLHFLHGVSPDGEQLGYIRLDPQGDNWWAAATVRVLDLNTGEDRPITTDPGPADGCEWTPDGQWIMFNTEQFSSSPGHAQIARVRPNGTGLEQLTFDERVNWFPHPAPTGDVAVYLSYPPGIVGHPPDLPVELRLVRLTDWSTPTTIARLLGGQGTINVPSWAPDGSAFAFVDYPVDD